ncbi:FG-GAP repeat domain protein [Streptomyces laurentii]|uniref:FG-GAP repeat domain protein n=1 Tax=Streptomyces laurentii TaxID=39478 RepID=A0A160PAA5_STRLU|nr:FG-GAP repeat domain protein [Streptomyces laurentii]
MRKFKSGLAFLGSIAFFLVASFTGVPTALAKDVVSASTSPPLRFSTYNICGNYCVKADDSGIRVSAVVAETDAAGWKADVVFVQEICKYQYEQIRTQLTPRGFSGHYVPTIAANSSICLNKNSSYGMAVFAKGAIHADATWQPAAESDGLAEVNLLSGTGVETEGITSPCMRVFVQHRSTWVCSVHLWWPKDSTDTAGVAARDANARILYQKVKEWQDKGVPVIVGGDFNGQPWTDATKPFYSSEAVSAVRGTGAMTEVDETDAGEFQGSGVCDGATRCRSGEVTHDGRPTGSLRKIDYIFATSSFFKEVRGDVQARNVSISDHSLLRGTARWADCGPAEPTASALFRVDASGALFRYASHGNGTLAPACKVGFGWGNMSQIARQGSDLIALDQAGALWRYPADPTTGEYSGSTRVNLGSGLSGITAMLTPGDTDGDNTRDLLVRNSLGQLLRYPGTGAGGYNLTAPVTLNAPASGQTWNRYKLLVAAGDFARSAADKPSRPDLIGIDNDGKLWLHRGNSDTDNYDTAADIGQGWQVYTALAAPGDLNSDGNPDLVARDETSGTHGKLWYYKGDGADGYDPKVEIGNGYPKGEPLF